ncbi:MAG TPA: hypothetical protein VFA72_16840 [Burkholderiales bacterium]|nr:hypothetical protein [Burkholderiales bacterium]
MESSKTHSVTYDGKDALATLVAEFLGGKVTDAQAKIAVEKVIEEATPRRRHELQQFIRDLGILLAVVPAHWRRDIMVKVAVKIKAKQEKRARQRAFRRQYPALRHSRMLSIANWFFCEDEVTNIFVPAVSDYLLEYRRALKEGGRWKAFVVKVRHWHAFLDACGLEKWGKVYTWIQRLSALVIWIWHKLHSGS